ncbi:MAG: hypothetical protein QGF46_06195 [Planctomycetota bacterium]|jgi:hypothetical protein|nr:hypothetical protein [Planctomycetota bacterium]
MLSDSSMSCFDFQVTLSQMLDSELTDSQASTAMMHLNGCAGCSDFFSAIRLQALAHTELSLNNFNPSEPSSAAARGFLAEYDDAEIASRLSSALYQLGKAYTLIASSEDSYLLSVSEAPVDIEEFSNHEAAEALADAQLAGTNNSEEIELPIGKKHALAKAKTLLEQSLALNPDYCEALLYLGQVNVHLNNFDAAIKKFKQVFNDSDRLTMRVHAAIQVAMVLSIRERHREALRYYRWVVASGILQIDASFGIVFHNIAVQHKKLNNHEYAQNALLLYRDYNYEGWEQSMNLMENN